MRRKIFPLVLLLLAACGQKGPLYLPQEAAAPARPVAVPPPVPPAEAGEAEEEEEEQPQATGADDDREEEPVPEK